MDYHRLNNVTKNKGSHPPSRFNDTLDTLVGSKLCSTLNWKSGYWQVEMMNMLRRLSYQTCLVYLNDIIVLRKTFAERLKKVDVFKYFKFPN